MMKKKIISAVLLTVTASLVLFASCGAEPVSGDATETAATATTEADYGEVSNLSLDALTDSTEKSEAAAEGSSAKVTGAEAVQTTTQTPTTKPTTTRTATATTEKTTTEKATEKTTEKTTTEKTTTEKTTTKPAATTASTTKPTTTSSTTAATTAGTTTADPTSPTFPTTPGGEPFELPEIPI